MNAPISHSQARLLRVAVAAVLSALLFSGCAYLRGSAQINSGQAPHFAIGTSVPLGK